MSALFQTGEKAKEEVKQVVTPSLPVPAFGDLGKAANDVCEH